MAKFTMIAALALGFGCDDKGDSVGESDTDTDADSDTDTDADVPTEIQITWDTSSVNVDVTGGTGNLEFGITEESSDPWEAEDCIGGTTGGFGNFCHTVAANDSTTINCVDVPKDVTDSTTLFCGVVKENGGDSTLTYYLSTMDDSWCAVAGANIAYFSSEGCENWNK